MLTSRTILIVATLSLLGPAATGARGEGGGLTPEGRDRLILWQDCAGYRALNEMARTDFAGIPLASRDGKPVLQQNVAGESFCMVSRKGETESYAAVSCVWMRYGDEQEADIRAMYERRRKSIPACRSALTPVLVLPQGRLEGMAQSHFMAQGGTESWSLGYGKVGQTWFVELHAFGPLP